VPRADALRSELARPKTAEAALRKDLAIQEASAGKAKAEAAKKREGAARTRSESTRRMSLRAAEAQEKKVAAAEKKAGELLGKLASNAKAQSAKSRSLGDAEKQELSAKDREDARRRRLEKEHAREVGRLASATIRHVAVRLPEPDRLRLLYLTANPEVEDPEMVLRVDAEVRMVREALRKSPHRDLVQFDHRPAATPEDLIEGINETRPHIIHFSGHGGGRGVLFDNGSVDAPQGRDVDFNVLAEILSATNIPPMALVLNACETLDGADVLLPAVPVVVAMSDTIGDLAASVFATRFYAAVASAQSLGSALRQGIVGIRLTDPQDAHLPSHLARDDVDIDALVLVAPAQA
jgi:hypothetical protein